MQTSFLIFAVGVGGLMACSEQPLPRADGKAGDPALPDQVAGWQVESFEQFDTETIYGYIDGHAEVYMAYGMKRCLSWRYQGGKGEPAIVADLFELGSHADAFGAFTHDRDGEDIDIGQGGLLRSGWLSFWKGSWYGSIYAEGESEATRLVLIEIAERAAQALGDDGEVPALVGELPEKGLDTHSIRFLRTQEILNMVVYLGFDNTFGLGPEVSAVVGHYQLAEGSGWLLLVEYPDEETAGRAGAAAEEAGMAVNQSGRRLAAVLAPQPTEAADFVLNQIEGGFL